MSDDFMTDAMIDAWAEFCGEQRAAGLEQCCECLTWDTPGNMECTEDADLWICHSCIINGAHNHG